jgi:hypothetical protein
MYGSGIGYNPYSVKHLGHSSGRGHGHGYGGYHGYGHGKGPGPSHGGNYAYSSYHPKVSKGRSPKVEVCDPLKEFKAKEEKRKKKEKELAAQKKAKEELRKKKEKELCAYKAA